MTDTDSIKNDIAYVRAVAEHTNTAHVPAIYLIWAGICVCGFSLVDLVGPGSRWIGMYWLVTGPVGGALSWWLAVQAGNRAGQVDRRKGKRWAGHFLGFFAIGLLGCALAAAGELSWSGLTSLWILLLALTYLLAGLHLERRRPSAWCSQSATCSRFTCPSTDLRRPACSWLWHWWCRHCLEDVSSMRRTDPADVEGLEELGSLQGLLEHRVRLAICVLLSEHDAMSFSRLKQVLGETDGSLGTHLRKLEDSEYLAVEKSFATGGP